MNWGILAVLVVFLASCTTGNVVSEMNKDIVVLETNRGDIEITLYTDKAPNTVENFKSYVQAGFYENTVFHRVIEGFMIQGGGFTPTGAQKSTNDPIALEVDAGISNTKGTIAMARTNNPDSATAQFFINGEDNRFLDPGVQGPGYAVFGEVTSGMEVVEEIISTQTTTKNGMRDWPVQDIIIQQAYLKE